MTSPTHHPVPRFTRRVRRVLCALLAATMVLTPVLSTAAQTHEAAHAAQGVLHFHAAEHGHRTHVADQGDMPDEGGLLHGLTHAAHACGHVFAILGSSAVAALAATDVIVLPFNGAPPGDAPRAHPFRPPIV